MKGYIQTLILLFSSIGNSYTQVLADSILNSLASTLSQQLIERSITSVAVLDFTEDTAVTKFSLGISEDLKLRLVLREKSINVVDRKHTDRLMEEQRLSLSPLFNEDRASAIGNLISADAIITGKVSLENDGWRLTTQIIKVETGILIGGTSVVLYQSTNPNTSMNKESISYPRIDGLNESQINPKDDSLQPQTGLATFLLMNGRELKCEVLEDLGTVFLCALTKDNGKVLHREIHKNDLFSVKFDGYAEKTLYMQDEMMGDIYSTDEMRFYLAGEDDARQNFDAWPTFAVGFALCAGVSLWGGDGYMTAVGPPIFFTLLQLAPKIKIREKTMSHPEYKYNDIYADGYEPPARTRKLSRAMQGGFLGSATGVACWFLFLNK